MKRLRRLAAEQYHQQVDCEVDMSTADHHNKWEEQREGISDVVVFVFVK